ncbi:2-C-methyl-D-erythritol 4-phosphate cytidylyltransferase [Streptomyces sp. NP160]|uniref:2-C-methyl-D-erythritol 4-phosphate cytidylyltransferase n=1 Tax=Streptomyces sp. NP160 TaxID=2586637 RepID=UPI0011185B1A|nr:2-C-methyl-D-erythritol 4-phosphate cytidylyltransferase [Streptomyces sp. NP160]TNM59297.1 2-C-methyl-D-erythritol 4-phosphate cytidylyltransferase [Streptomyces sp. NP160]
MSTGCVLVAAGSGTRLAAGSPKAFVVLDGRPLLVHAAERVLRAGVCEQLVLVVPDGRQDESTALVSGLPGAGGVVLRAVAGGADRRSSVAAGLAALPPDVDVVLVHDAARCLTPPEQVAAVERAVRAGAPAVVPGVAVSDTVRAVDVEGVPRGGPLDRAALRLVQTPQGFRRDVVERAHAAAVEHGLPAALAATDDASLVELLGTPVLVVPGREEAFKVTRPLDLALATAVLAQQRSAGALS